MSSSPNLVRMQLDDEKMSRIGSFVLVTFATWGLFAFDNSVTGHSLTAFICTLGASSCFICYWMVKLGKSYQWWAGHFFMGLNLTWICVITCFTGMAESYAPLFLCCFGLFASHLIGIRASLFWSIACVTCLIAIQYGFWAGEFPVLHEHTTFDKTTHCIGVIVIVFFLNSQAQQFLNYQTNALVDLTDLLEDQVSEYEKLAQYDTLTHLYNRFSFEQHLKKAIRKAKVQRSRLALLLLDLDGFKQINDTQGHKAGDQILKSVAERLTLILRSNDFVARLGGDEFTIVLENIKGTAQVLNFTDRVAKTLLLPHEIDGKDYYVGVSIGIAVFPDHASTPGDLLAFADTAMYASKNDHKNLVLYQPSMTAQLIERRAMEDKLVGALANEEFTLFYQPQVEVSGGKVIGAEALLRWQKDGRWIPPSEFIGPLETNREIRQVGRWVLKQACCQARHWFDQGFKLPVSVNVSSVQFQDPYILDNIYEALDTSSLDPSLLDIEITESMLIEDIDKTYLKLKQLRDLGVSISIDDFGTGYSSLAYLKELPLTRLKIDRTFIKGIPDKDDGLIAQTIIDLTHSLSLDVLAEGVEEVPQLEFLRDNLCDQYQGFYFSRPLPAEEFEKRFLGGYVEADTFDDDVKALLTSRSTDIEKSLADGPHKI